MERMAQMRRQKIFFVLPKLSRDDSNHYWHILELLQKAGETLDVFLFVERGEDRIAKGRIKNLYYQKFSWPPLTILERLFLFVLNRLRGYKNFYVHQSVFSSFLAVGITRLLGGRVFFWHCGQVHIYEEEQGKRDWLFRLNIQLIDCLVTASEGMKTYYHVHFQIPRGKIRILPGWVNIKRFKNVNQARVQALRKSLGLKRKKVVVFVHWLSPRKGTRYLPEIVKQTTAKDRSSVFLVVGEGPDFTWLQRQFKIQHLQSKVRLLGSVPNLKIPVILRMARVFIMPSREEELGRVQLEAMAVQIPIVAFRTISTNDFLSNIQKELVAPQGDINEFVKRIVKAIENQKRYALENGKQIRKYSLTNVAREFVKLTTD
jgi:glycosyltransferase involved in cell wall biosynthesis